MYVVVLISWLRLCSGLSKRITYRNTHTGTGLPYIVLIVILIFPLNTLSVISFDKHTLTHIQQMHPHTHTDWDTHANTPQLCGRPPFALTQFHEVMWPSTNLVVSGTWYYLLNYPEDCVSVSVCTLQAYILWPIKGNMTCLHIHTWIGRFFY